MSMRSLVALLTVLGMLTWNAMEVDGAKNRPRPGQSPGDGRQVKGGKGKKTKAAPPNKVEAVANSIRQAIGMVAAKELPPAMAAYDASRANLRNLEAQLIQLQRDYESEKATERGGIAERAINTRKDFTRVEREYAAAMLRVRDRMRNTNQTYRSVSAELESARRAHESIQAYSIYKDDKLAALGKVVRLEAQLEEMETEALAADEEAQKAKSEHDELKAYYIDARRELANAGGPDAGRKSAITEAYRAVADARRDVIAKGRAVESYKSLIRTATFQRQVIGLGGG